jgi:hypothetical protein
MSEYPECERLAEVAPKSQVIGEFLDWLANKGIALGTWDGDMYLRVHSYVPNELLAEFFEIDLKLVERERAQLLSTIREEQDP